MEMVVTEHSQRLTQAKQGSHVFDSYTAGLLCLAVILAFGLGFTMGAAKSDRSAPSMQTSHSVSHNVQASRNIQTFGRLGHIQER